MNGFPFWASYSENGGSTWEINTLDLSFGACGVSPEEVCGSCLVRNMVSLILVFLVGSDVIVDFFDFLSVLLAVGFHQRLAHGSDVFAFVFDRFNRFLG